MNEQFDSEWFMAVNERNRFAVVHGVSRTSIDAGVLLAELFAGEPCRLHAIVRANLESGSKVIGSVTRALPGAEPVPVRGYHFQTDEVTLGDDLCPDGDVSILVTDGWTTVGIAKPAWE